MDHLSRKETASEGNEWSTGHEWLKFIFKTKEKDLLELIGRKPELSEKKIEIECLAAGVSKTCNCCYGFESLKYLTGDLNELLSLVETGRCPHVSEYPTEDRPRVVSSKKIMKCSFCLQFPSSLQPKESLSESEYCEKITIKNMQFYCEDCEDTIDHETRLCGTSEACKFQEPLDFNVLRQAWMSLFLPSDRVMEGSGIVTAGVTLIHVAASLGYLKLVKKILTLANQSSHSTLHYRLLPLYHGVIFLQVGIAKLLIDTIKFGTHTNFSRYYALAVMRNNIPMLSIFVKCVTNLTHPNTYTVNYNQHIVYYSYQKELGSGIALKHKCNETLKYLCSTSVCRMFKHKSMHMRISGLPKMEWIEEDDMKKMFVNNDIQSFRYLLKLPINQAKFLRYAVFYDRTDMAQMLISDAMQKRQKLRSSQAVLNYLTQAVLNNSVTMLKILLKGYKYLEPKDTGDGRHTYTSHTWAVVLGFQDCVDVLRKTSIPYQEKVVRRLPPLVAVFHKKVDSYHNKKIALINLLINNGWSIFSKSDNGVTPLYMAMQSEMYEYVRPLLRLGIDPFIGINCLPVFVSRRFLAEFLYANVDIFKRRYGISLLMDILHRDSRFQEFRPDLCFLLRHAHTIPEDDVACLLNAKEVPSIPEDIKNDIDVFLRTPRTLQISARDSLRRHYGVSITYFLHYQVPELPETIKRYILLEDCLEAYLQQDYKKVYLSELTDF